eukprot:Rhum_TRINITY_DN12588_c0_g1::Rhum_TRINITY_DN12588_c0_g1_i2::g.52982::m.52982
MGDEREDWRRRLHQQLVAGRCRPRLHPSCLHSLRCLELRRHNACNTGVDAREVRSAQRRLGRKVGIHPPHRILPQRVRRRGLRGDQRGHLRGGNVRHQHGYQLGSLHHARTLHRVCCAQDPAQLLGEDQLVLHSAPPHLAVLAAEPFEPPRVGLRLRRGVARTTRRTSALLRRLPCKRRRRCCAWSFAHRVARRRRLLLLLLLLLRRRRTGTPGTLCVGGDAVVAVAVAGSVLQQLEDVRGGLRVCGVALLPLHKAGWCRTRLVLCGDVSAGVAQDAHNVNSVRKHGFVQCGVSALARRVYGSAVVEKQADHLVVRLAGSDVEGSLGKKPAPVANVGAAVQQPPRLFDVAVTDSGEKGDIVLCFCRRTHLGHEQRYSRLSSTAMKYRYCSF